MNKSLGLASCRTFKVRSACKLQPKWLPWSSLESQPSPPGSRADKAGGRPAVAARATSPARTAPWPRAQWAKVGPAEQKLSPHSGRFFVCPTRSRPHCARAARACGQIHRRLAGAAGLAGPCRRSPPAPIRLQQVSHLVRSDFSRAAARVAPSNTSRRIALVRTPLDTKKKLVLGRRPWDKFACYPSG